MKSFKSAYINEIYKISKKKKLICAMIISVAAAILFGVFFSGINYLTGIRLMGSNNFALALLPFLEYTIVPLFTAFVCIDMFSGEFSTENIKLTLMRPVNRFKIYAAKTAAAATFVMSFLIFSYMCAIVVAFFSGGIEISVLKPLLAYVLAFFPMMVFALMVMFVSNISRGSASAFLLSVVLVLVFKGTELMNPMYKSFFFTSMLDWHKLFLGAYINVFKILRILMIFAGYSLMFFSAGYLVFDNKKF